MLPIVIPAVHLYDNKSDLFIDVPETALELEHCLHSVYEWERKWKKPFLDNKKKTIAETRDYIQCMTVTKNVDPLVYYGLTNDNLRRIEAYIQDPMTATTFSDRSNGKRAKRDTITAEIMYYWIVSFGIPMEAEYWHLNSLIALVKVCDTKNRPSKKMKKGDVLSRNAALNAARRQRLNTRG